MNAAQQKSLENTQERVDEYRELFGTAEEISDGYHTFKELYAHRIQLWITCCKLQAGLDKVLDEYASVKGSETSGPWRTQHHSDGSQIEGWFVLGLGKRAEEQMTYHLPMSKWEECSFAETLDKAPDWDSHTSDDVLERLKNL